MKTTMSDAHSRNRSTSWLSSFLYRMKNPRGRTSRFQRIQKRVFNPIWRILVALRILESDPVVQVQIGKKHLLMNSSHRLQSLLQRPFYDTALPRLAKFICQKRGNLVMIDVGANIGDTVSLVSDSVAGEFLCVEPNLAFYRFLKHNTRTIPRVTCVNALISTTSDRNIAASTAWATLDP